MTAGQRTDLDQAFALASLWLSEATTISELAAPPRTLTRGGWVEATLPGVAGARRARGDEHRRRAHRGAARSGARRDAEPRAGRGPAHADGRRLAVRLPARPGRRQPLEGGRQRRRCRHPAHARRRGGDPPAELRGLRPRPRDPRRPAGAVHRHPRARARAPVPARALAAAARHLAGHRLRARRPRRHRRARRARLALRPLRARGAAPRARERRAAADAVGGADRRARRGSRTSSRRSRAGSTS